MKNIKTHLAVIGGGPAGISAAITAAECGLKVCLFEKSNHTGGASNGGMGPFAVESRLQIQKKHKFSKEDAFNFFMEFTHWHVDARLVRAYIEKSAETIDWLEQRGIRFVDLVAYFPGAQFTWHMKDMKTPPIMTTLTELAIKLGVDIYLETPVKKIIRGANGINGIIATDKSGEEIQVTAKAVVVATGGFGDNPEMIKKYTGLEWGKDLFSMRVPGLTGDGIRMAWEVGAAPTPMYMDVYACLPPPYNGPGGTTTELAPFRHILLMVNQHGTRFCNEEVCRNVGMAAHAVHRQKNGCAIKIIDENTRRQLETYEKEMTPKEFMTDIPADFAGTIIKARSEGYTHLFMTQTLEELATQADIDPANLIRTIDEYNRACETGRDTLFFTHPEYLRPIKQPPFYGARFFCGGYGSLGGIKINYKTEVLDENDQVIPGLYAAGTDANSIYGDTYPFALSGNTSGFAYNTGRIAGENAVAYIKQSFQ